MVVTSGAMEFTSNGIICNGISLKLGNPTTNSLHNYLVSSVLLKLTFHSILELNRYYFHFFLTRSARDDYASSLQQSSFFFVT